jgi:hypothetical protein
MEAYRIALGEGLLGSSCEAEGGILDWLEGHGILDADNKHI